jgi:hypothetical protein
VPSDGPPSRGNYDGLYRLIVTATQCTASFPEAAKTRVYAARVRQTGHDLKVTLSGATFLPHSGTFSGSIDSTGAIHFEIFPLTVWDYGGPDISEQLSDGTELVIMGPVTAIGTPTGISGRMLEQESGAGGIFHLPPRGAVWSLQFATGSCFVDRFVMVRKS